MIPPPAQKKVSFADIAFKGKFRFVFILFIIVAIAGIAAGAGLRAKAPQSYSGTAQHDTVSIEVTDNSEQPVDILISHEYALEVDYPYYSVEGEDHISYNITILDRGGQQIYRQQSSFEVPMTLKVDKYSSSATYTGSAKHWANLLPGSYEVSIDSTAPVEYKVVQRSKSQALSDGLLALGGVYSFMLILLSFIVLKKRDAINRANAVAILSGNATAGTQMGPAAPPAPLINYPAAPPTAPPQYHAPPPPPPPIYPDPSLAPVVRPPPAYWTGAAPVPDPVHRSSLEYVPGGFYRELICPNCGGMVRNQPVYGIVTCEHCGEPSRIY